MTSRDTNPYVGPLPLPRGRKIYGRSWEIHELADVLASERIALLYSPSGAGKSSIINAGLVPLLEEQRDFFVYPIVRLNHLPPKEFRTNGFNRYIWSTAWFATANVTADDDTHSTFMQPSLREALESAAPPPVGREKEDEYDDDEPTIQRRLLIIDQAEELFTLDPADIDDKKAFVDELLAAMRDPYLFVLIAMREEYISLIEEYLPNIPLSGRFRLDFLSMSSAEEAIKFPAHDHNVKFGDELARELALNLSLTKTDRRGSPLQEIHGEVEPVQIQLVCRKMWKDRNKNSDSITKNDFPDEGQLSRAVNNALADYYTDVVEEVSEECGVAQMTLRKWINTKLITRDGLRDQFWRGQLLEYEIPIEAIDALESRHLIRSDTRGNRIFYELAHDRLVDPIRKEHQVWKKVNLEPFQLRAEQFQAGKTEQLLSRQEYREAKKWTTDRDYEPSQSERVFLKASSDRLTRRSLIWSGIAILITIGGTFAVWNETNEHAQLSWRNDILAELTTLEANLEFSEDEFREAVTRSQELREENRLQFVGSTLREAQLLASIDEYAEAKGVLDKLEPGDISPDHRVGAAMLSWYLDNLGLKPAEIVQYHTEAAHSLTSIAISPSGTWLFASGKYGNAFVVNRESGNFAEVTREVNQDWILDPIFLANDSQLIARNASGRVLSWTFTEDESGINQEVTFVTDSASEAIRGIRPDAAQARLLKIHEDLCAGTQSQGNCWTLRSGPLSGASDTVIFQPDHSLSVLETLPNGLIIVGGANQVYAIKPSGEILSEHLPGDITAMRADRSGEHLIIATIDGSVVVVSLSESRTLDTEHAFNVGDAPIRAADFLYEDFAVVAGDDQKIRIIDIPSGQQVQVLEGHRSAIMDLLVTPENEILSVGLDGQILRWRPLRIGKSTIVNLDELVDEHCTDNPCPQRQTTHNATSVAHSPDLDTVFVGLERGGFLAYSRAAESLTWYNPEPGRMPVRRLAIDETGKYLAVGDLTVRLFDIGSMSMIAQADAFLLTVTSLEFSPNAATPTVYASSNDGRIAMLNTRGDATYYPSEPVNTSASNRNYDRDINSIAVDCSGTQLVTTTNTGPTLWPMPDGVPNIDNTVLGRDSLPKILSADIWKPDGIIFDAGMAGTRRQHEGLGPHSVVADVRGRSADIYKVSFGPYGKTIHTIDANGVFSSRNISDDRDFLSFELPSVNGKSTTERTRDFSFRCSHGPEGQVQECAIAFPLGKRPGILLIDLGASLSTDTLFSGDKSTSSHQVAKIFGDKSGGDRLPIETCATIALEASGTPR